MAPQHKSRTQDQQANNNQKHKGYIRKDSNY